KSMASIPEFSCTYPGASISEPSRPNQAIDLGTFNNPLARSTRYFMQDSLRRYYALGVGTLGFVVVGLALLSYPTISTLVSREFGLSNTESGLLTSSFALTYAAMQFPAGILTDRLGGARSLLLALSITTL